MCSTFLHQVSNEYDFTELVNPGLAKHSIRTKQTSLLTGQNYTQRVVPHITEMSSHSSGVKGASLRLVGTGFSSKLQDYECSIAG